MTGAASVPGAGAVERFLRPRSVAIVGMSARPGSAGRVVLQSLELNEFRGDIHLVGRSTGSIDGRKVLQSPLDLPVGVDLAVLTLPAAGVLDAVKACVKRNVGSAMVFASGFAEAGETRLQDEVAETARSGGLALVGPNCIGYSNNVDGLVLHMLAARKAGRSISGSSPGLAFVGQSGGMLGHFQRACDARGMPVSYIISTGNEIGLDLSDFVEFLVDDPATRGMALYAEQVRRPRAFLEAIGRARAAGKPVVLMFPGRGAKAKQAAQSHTGALIGDYWTMRTLVEEAGAIVVSTIDEMIDLAEILARYPRPPDKGPAILTASGAFVALSNDFAEELGLEFPSLSDATSRKLCEVLPPYGTYGNPLDVTAGAAPESFPVAVKALLDDPNVGMLFISYPINNGTTVQLFNDGMGGSDKPKVLVALGDSSPLGTDVMDAVRQGPAVFGRSSDRMLRAIAHYTRYGRMLSRPRITASFERIPGLPRIPQGSLPEWLGKTVLQAAGIRIPAGELARTVSDATRIAREIGYPVALKAQASALSHKTEAGGVILGLRDEAELLSAWSAMLESVGRAAPGLALDGCLVEKMSPKGIELMVGAKRDPDWGTVLLVGLGGIWVEVMGDVQLLPCNASAEHVTDAIGRLRSVKLLSGFRGAPPADIEAVKEAVLAIGRLMRAVPELIEIDVNPLMVLPAGQGVLALDALMVAGPARG